ncbi:MAG: imidazole glycerol phosphate synthase subunit HisH [Bacteroidales bacterium]|nr:imidazole glycerol phosphate synthase subunit HisH [Bacteroidales bacterium]
MKTVIIDYNAGNVRSVYYALKRLGIEAEISDNPERIKSADKVIFPGVGEAGSTMQYLQSKGLDTVIRELTQPVLGICLGMQLLCSFSEEGNTKCLDIFPNSVKLFKGTEKVPHVGWNSIFNLKGDLFKNIPENSFVYFVHSYYVEILDDTVAACNYMQNFSAAIQKDNFYAVQFHPEKSGETGSQILKNFLLI